MQVLLGKIKKKMKDLVHNQPVVDFRLLFVVLAQIHQIFYT